MKRLASLAVIFSLFLSSCSTVTDITSDVIDGAADAAGVSGAREAGKAIKKAVISDKKQWDGGDIYADSDIVYGVSKAQKYLDELFWGLQKISEMEDNTGIYILRTARVQGMTSWGIQVRITRGMFNMIYDEAELVCLMGHEIGHMVLKHEEQGRAGLRNVSDTADDVTDIVLADSKYKRKVKKQQRRVLETKWSRENEKDADKYGADLAAKAGYDPYAFCDLFERLAARVDMGLAYRLQKLEGSHPALDDRAKSLREYLKKKGCKEGEGKRNRAQYLKGMSQVHVMRTGEGKKESAKIQKGIDEEGKKDLKRLDEIFKEVESLKKADNPVSMERFIEIMDEVCAICKKYGVTAEDVFGAEISAAGDCFMEEAIIQDSPFWEMFQSVKNAVAVKAGAIFNMLGHMAAGAIPVIGDAVDLYELFSGRDIFTGEKLSAGERALTALGLLAGSGAYRRNIARGIDKEAARLGLGGVRKSAADAVIKIEKHAADKSSVSAYDIAKSGGKNAGLYNQYYRKTDKELKNSIRSYQKQLDFHREKIKHPEKYISNYDKRKPEYIDGTVKHWKKEIETFSEQKEIIEGILIERGIL